MIFLTRKKLDKIIDDRIKLNKWHKFFDADKEGFWVKYDGLEWEVHCVECCIFSQILNLKIGNQKKLIKIYPYEPQDIEFIYQNE